VFVVRWALDDSVDKSVAAAIDALHALVYCTEDEVTLAMFSDDDDDNNDCCSCLSTFTL